jgi:hypothetical protein
VGYVNAHGSSTPLYDDLKEADSGIVTQLKEQYAFFDEITQSWRTVTGLAREEEE